MTMRKIWTGGTILQRSASMPWVPKSLTTMIQPALGDWYEYPGSVNPRANPAFADAWVTGATGGARQVVPQGVDAFRGCSGCHGVGDNGAVGLGGLLLAVVGVPALILGITYLMESGPGGVSGRRYNPRGKSLKAFIRENRAEIDAAIRRVCSNCRINDEERRLWVLNDEGLYRWARREGVRI